MTAPLPVGWKVITADRKSCLKNLLTYHLGAASAVVKYPRGRRVGRSPGHGPLAVFDTQVNARAFRSGYGDGHHVVRCRYVPSAAKHLWVAPQKFACKHFHDFPLGTILADYVTCLE